MYDNQTKKAETLITSESGTILRTYQCGIPTPTNTDSTSTESIRKNQDIHENDANQDIVVIDATPAIAAPAIHNTPESDVSSALPIQPKDTTSSRTNSTNIVNSHTSAVNDLNEISQMRKNLEEWEKGIKTKERNLLSLEKSLAISEKAIAQKDQKLCVAQTQIHLLETKVTQLTDKNDILCAKCGMLELKVNQKQDNATRIIELENEIASEIQTNQTLKDKCNMLEYKIQHENKGFTNVPHDTTNQYNRDIGHTRSDTQLLSDSYQKMLEHNTRISTTAIEQMRILSESAIQNMAKVQSQNTPTNTNSISACIGFDYLFHGGYKNSPREATTYPDTPCPFTQTEILQEFDDMYISERCPMTGEQVKILKPTVSTSSVCGDINVVMSPKRSQPGTQPTVSTSSVCGDINVVMSPKRSQAETQQNKSKELPNLDVEINNYLQEMKQMYDGSTHKQSSEDEVIKNKKKSGRIEESDVVRENTTMNVQHQCNTNVSPQPMTMKENKDTKISTGSDPRYELAVELPHKELTERSTDIDRSCNMVVTLPPITESRQKELTRLLDKAIVENIHEKEESIHSEPM